ncbi:tryptophanyl-tRNA synthetase [Nakamurella sp. UYEF19]|uniref:tryptophan--tRNA ligase n=1 Tax=Nakamurella sp. UYEF19 TaxID=1756392 RepID=UPI0033948C18
MTTIQLDSTPHDDAQKNDATFRRAEMRSAGLESEIVRCPAAHRVLTGDRPTGDLHLGHLLGTLANRVRLQRLGVPMTLVIADYQVITDRDHAGPLRNRVRTLVADYLAAGVDPDRTTIFPHSAVPALNQLMLPFLSLVTDAELRRNPTVKAETQAAGRPLGGLLLTYPVHQAADILFCGGTLVPVGRDQLPHLELTRAIARRFNERYGPLFDLPDALLSPVPLLLGTDGEKMSKSRGNAIALGADETSTARLIRSAKTDWLRQITFEPDARPEVASLLQIIASLSGRSPVDVAAEIGDAGSGALKALAVDVVNDSLRPLRARRRELLADPGYLDGVLLAGIAEANATANDTLHRVRSAMGMDYLS